MAPWLFIYVKMFEFCCKRLLFKQGSGNTCSIFLILLLESISFNESLKKIYNQALLTGCLPRQYATVYKIKVWQQYTCKGAGGKKGLGPQLLSSVGGWVWRAVSSGILFLQLSCSTCNGFQVPHMCAIHSSALPVANCFMGSSSSCG